MRRIIVGISGASGAQLGIRLLEALHELPEVETHLVVSHGAEAVLTAECGVSAAEVRTLADVCYEPDDLAARISSGSFVTDGMIVCPCSMKSLAAIVYGFDSTLLVRAADVCRKEGRRVVLVPREMPLSPAHARNLAQAAADGYAIVPPMLTFYNDAQTLDAQVDNVVGKVLMQFGIAYERFRPWSGPLSQGVWTTE